MDFGKLPENEKRDFIEVDFNAPVIEKDLPLPDEYSTWLKVFQPIIKDLHYKNKPFIQCQVDQEVLELIKQNQGKDFNLGVKQVLHFKNLKLCAVYVDPDSQLIWVLLSGDQALSIKI